jgi:hypothetical protein
MSLLSVTDLPDYRHLLLYDVLRDVEKRAEVKMTGLLQATSSGYLIVGVPTALVRGVFDAMHEPGISLPSVVDDGALRAGIVVMTPEEVSQLGGPNQIQERGKHFTYHLGNLEEAPAKGWPGVATCWHLRIKSAHQTGGRVRFFDCGGLPEDRSAGGQCDPKGHRADAGPSASGLDAALSCS